MSSASGDDEAYPSSRRRSSTPQSPRKRRRLASSDSSRRRKHEILRRHEVEAKYNDDYRLLFNEHVTQAAVRFDVDESIQHYSNQVGSSVWSSKEQAVFFAALERLGKDDTPGIASAIGTKTETETRDFLVLLQDAVTKQGDAKVTLRDIPAAIEVGNACNQQLEEVGDALAWYQERFEATQEQERYGDYWLITPWIAEDIEDAINGVTRPASASAVPESKPPRLGSGVAGACELCKKQKRNCDRQMPCTKCVKSNAECVYPDAIPTVNTQTPTTATQEPELKRFVSGVAGACAFCKKHKKKCDRRIPCTKCIKSNIECVYPKNPPNVIKPNATPTTIPDEGEGMYAATDDETNHAAGTGILRAIPEAKLLHPEVMLTLSREIFMNRSADFPSPWLHWSNYTSDLATEPSIYRTAFNDFHRLAISVTRRLVQTAIVQATSRLRAQPLRGKKGLHPFVKRRDIYTAIDILGMKRNSSERWQGAARRCGLRVLSSKTTAKGKRHREVPWSEVERIMSSVTSPDERSGTEAGTSAEPDNFRSRAARSGTPLPMHNLTLSDSEDYHEGAIDDANGDYIEHFTDDELLPSLRATVQGRDLSGRYTTVPPTTRTEEPMHQLDTLEDFDQEASRQEEHALWEMLGLEPTTKEDYTKTDDDLEHSDIGISEKVTAVSDDWRQSMDYRAMWETHRKPIPIAKFIANQKLPSPMPVTHAARSYSTTPPSGNVSDASSTSGSRRPTRRLPVEVELRARGTIAYAALQRDAPGRLDDSEATDKVGDGSEDMEKDIPTQSIEGGPDAESSGDDMDWS